MKNIKNIHQFQELAHQILDKEMYAYLTGGTDDKRTCARNIAAYSDYQIRPRVLRDVSKIDTTIELLDESFSSPILLAPIGILGMFHPEGAKAVARAAAAKQHGIITSTVTNFSYSDIVKASGISPWFQLYATSNESARKELIVRAEDQGCKVLVCTVDVPVLGNRESNAQMLTNNYHGRKSVLGNLDGLLGEDDLIHPSSLTWDYIAWLREQTNMKIVLKGILTAEDALLSVQHGVDGIIVSNHGGRQLETDMGTIECLEEIVAAVAGRIPVLIDGGIRRGTDVFKALALGATAVCIGRPYVYGLSAAGQEGVERVLEILQEELVRNMRLAGVVNVVAPDILSGGDLNTGSNLAFPRQDVWGYVRKKR